jgi:hypothetical protein
VDCGYNINGRKRGYCLSDQVKENLRNESNVNLGGRPTLSEEKRTILEEFIVDNSTDSRFIKKIRLKHFNFF